MRISGGKAKGRRLRGTISPGARPTTERVRAAVFNILSAAQVEGSRVLDLYAGSGSLGIEALSRGAEWADFMERDRRQCGVLDANLAGAGFSEQSKVYCADVERGLSGLSGPYRLVLMDPPYRFLEIGRLLEAIGGAKGLLEEAASLVVGHSNRLELEDSYGSLVRFSHRRYGDNAVDFYQKGDSGW